MARPKTVQPKTVELTVRLTKSQSKQLVSLANKYTQGNRSELLRDLVDQLAEDEIENIRNLQGFKHPWYQAMTA